MKILIIHPPYKRDKLYIKPIKAMGVILPNLGLLYLAAVLENQNHIVKIIDGPALAVVKNYSYKNLTNDIKKFNPDVIGISASTSQIPLIDLVLNSIKYSDTTPQIFLGGTGISADTNIILNYPKINFGIIGEAEFAFMEIIKKLEQGKDIKESKGLVWKENNKVLFKYPDKINNLDSLPLPSWHLLDLKIYKPSVANYRKLPSVPLVTGRGCPYSCIFCSRSTEGLKYRAQSAERVVEEIENLVNNFKVKDIQFYDDIFTMDIDRVKKICQLIIEKNIKIMWTCRTRVDKVNVNILKLMKKAGCYQIAVGIESGSDRILKYMKKGITKEQIINFCKITKKEGIDTRAFFIFGFPTETKKEIKETIKFMLKLKLDVAQIMIFTPLPGTEAWKEAKKYGKIDETDFSNFTYYPPNKIPFSSDELSEKELLQLYSQAYRKFYLRPSYLLNKLFKIRTIEDIKRNFIAFKGIISFKK